MKPDRAVGQVLMASYLYYCHDVAMMPDEEFDKLCKLLLEHLDELTHPHEFLLGREALEAGSLYYMREHDYPPMVCMAAVRAYLEGEVRRQGGKKKQMDKLVSTTLVLRVVTRAVSMYAAVQHITDNLEV